MESSHLPVIGPTPAHLLRRHSSSPASLSAGNSLAAASCGLHADIAMDLRYPSVRDTCRITGSGHRELALLGDPLECLGRTLDPVLTIIPVGRQQADHFVGAAGGRSRYVACGKIHSFSNSILMLQRHLHYARERRPIPMVPGSRADLKVGDL